LRNDLPHRGFDRSSVYEEHLRQIERAIQTILAVLYRGVDPTPSPLSDKTPKQIDRNEEIRTRHVAGVSISQLAIIPCNWIKAVM
jgi:hypothetical protein